MTFLYELSNPTAFELTNRVCERYRDLTAPGILDTFI